MVSGGKTVPEADAKSSSAVASRSATPEGERASPCAVHGELVPKLNLAAHESGRPALRDLRVENIADAPLENLRLTLAASPPFAAAKAWTIDRLEPGGVVRIDDLALPLNGEFLRDLTESTRGDVRLRLQGDDVALAETAMPIELLAPNQWGGAASMPELLAAFCTPNDPAVDRVLRIASEVLRQAGKPDAIDGYHSGSRQRVWEIASAIYTAIANLGLGYALPPASFEEQGQKVRLPSAILEGKVATCLDTAMLFAAAFEQAGFNPIVAMPKEHAMVGVWLQPEELASVVVDDAEPLRKGMALEELLLLETTFVTSSPAPLFSAAVEEASDSCTTSAMQTSSPPSTFARLVCKASVRWEWRGRLPMTKTTRSRKCRGKLWRPRRFCRTSTTWCPPRRSRRRPRAASNAGSESF